MAAIELKIASLDYSINQLSGKFFYREESRGDRGVIEQIFQDQDYNTEFWLQGQALSQYYHRLVDRAQPALIIDAGANIGASVIYFAAVYPQTRIVAVEPESNNFELLLKNVQHLDGVSCLSAAIGSVCGSLYLHDPGLSDWGFRVNGDQAAGTPVAVVTPSQILDANSGAVPFICKIDIEGAEEELFSQQTDWVDRFALLVIELHDWMLPFAGSSRNFLKIISGLDFDLLQKGENLFCFNRRLLRPLIL